MSERPSIGRPGYVSALLFGWIFLALCLIGYHPTDPPGSAAFPPGPPANPCGPVGAGLAFGLIQAVGWAAYVLLPALGALILLTARRRPIPEPGQRLLGLTLLITALAALIQGVAILAPDTLPSAMIRHSPPIGPGGYLGALAVAGLGGQFGTAGMLLILGAVGLTGLVLCHEILLVWPVEELGALIGLVRYRFHRGASLAPVIGGPPALASPGSLDPGAPRLAPWTSPPQLTRAPMPPPGLAHPALADPNRPASAPAPAGTGTPQPVGDGTFQLPPLELLDPPARFPIQEHEAEVHNRALLLEKTLREHGYIVRVVQIDTGPVITMFEIELEAGLRVARIMSLDRDLAIALAVPSVRIIAPIPGKSTVGIEVPNERRAFVKIGEVIDGVASRLVNCRIPLFLGKDAKGVPLVYDLADMPHLLIAGRTGTGKSVCLNAMILSLLMTKRPDEVKVILIDPKKVELSQFKRIPHLMHPVITENKKSESLLSWACELMDERYTYLARAEVRHVQAYNQLGPDEIYNRLRPEDEEERQRIPTYMPFIVIIIDEMGDLIAEVGKEVETHIVRLAQKARAAGIHLILTTQKPTVDVITGLIKSNLPARIAFQVTSRNDSRVVLDEMGAEKLLGHGDMLFLIPGTSHLIRAQGTYVSEPELTRVLTYLSQYPVEFSRELMQLQVSGGPGGKDRGAVLKERDELYEPAIEIIIREGRGSCSLLQRALGIGYGRASRLIDFMAEDGIVGEYKSGGPREVLYSWDEWETLKTGGTASDSAA